MWKQTECEGNNIEVAEKMTDIHDKYNEEE